MFSWLVQGQRAGAKLFWIDVTVPTFIGHSHIGVTLIAELSLIPVTIHTGTVQTDGICLLVTRLVGSFPVPYDGEFPVLQKCLVIDSNEGLRFNALLFILFCRKLRLGDIARLSTHRVVPNRIGNQSEEDEEPRDNFLPIIHDRVFPPHPPLSPPGERKR